VTKENIASQEQIEQIVSFLKKGIIPASRANVLIHDYYPYDFSTHTDAVAYWKWHLPWNKKDKAEAVAKFLLPYYGRVAGKYSHPLPNLKARTKKAIFWRKVKDVICVRKKTVEKNFGMPWPLVLAPLQNSTEMECLRQKYDFNFPWSYVWMATNNGSRGTDKHPLDLALTPLNYACHGILQGDALAPEKFLPWIDLCMDGNVPILVDKQERIVIQVR
jgi:hypothetical protein